MDLDLGAGVFSVEVLRQRRNGLDFLQLAAMGVIGVRGQRRPHLINQAEEPSIRMKGQVPRTGPRLDRTRSWVVRSESGPSWVHPVNKNFVETEVTGQGKLVACIGSDEVRMG